MTYDEKASGKDAADVCFANTSFYHIDYAQAPWKESKITSVNANKIRRTISKQIEGKPLLPYDI